MTKKQRERQRKVIKGVQALRNLGRGSKEGWKLLGKHVAKKFVDVMEREVFISR